MNFDFHEEISQEEFDKMYNDFIALRRYTTDPLPPTKPTEVFMYGPFGVTKYTVKQKERHYKWEISFTRPPTRAITRIITEHYVSENKIKDYCSQVLKLDGYKCKKTDDFVED